MPERSNQLTSRVLDQEKEFVALRTEWQILHAASPDASTALDHLWLREWWRVYGPEYGGDGLRIVTVRHNDTLVAGLPLYLGRERHGPLSVRVLRSISSGEQEHEESCAEYLGVLLHRDAPSGVVAVLAEAVGAIAWDRFALQDVDTQSLVYDSAFDFRGPGRAFRRVESRSPCPIADLGQGFESYLSSLSANSRSQARSRLRKCARAGGRLELADESNADEIFADLMTLHQQRWNQEGKPGCFAAPRFVEFHRALIRAWLPEGRAVLARLSLEGKPLAVVYGFVTAGKFDMYQLGVDFEGDAKINSPGIVANLLLMRTLCERGVTAYDFLGGTSRYKRSLSNRERMLVSLRWDRPSIRNVLFSGVGLASRAWRRLRRLRA